jgi:hypothetical protein
MRRRLTLLVALLAGSALGIAAEAPRELSVRLQPIAADRSVAYDYDIIYVRAPRRAGGKEIRWAEFGNPTSMEPGADLMLLHPDGREELLVSGGDGSVMDPYVSFDGEWVYYSRFVDSNHRGADIQEPLTDVSGHRQPLFGSHANERMRILGEIPVRKLDGGKQPLDADGNPDTSFLAKIPADQSFTFQTIDKLGMAPNMAQTWHQVRPGEVRNDCGGCHAHSQKPTEFAGTFAARADYEVFDLTKRTPLVTAKASDASGRKWDKDDQTGLRYVEGALNVEYKRDIRPILDRSCVACHTKSWSEPAGGLVLDDDDDSQLEDVQLVEGDEAPRLPLPATYRRLASRRGRDSFYMRRFQSRNSYLIWKVHGRRLDGWTNDTFPSPVAAKDPASGLLWKGEKVPEYEKILERVGTKGEDPVWLQIFVDNYGDADFKGGIMPPPDAVAGKYEGPDGKSMAPPRARTSHRASARRRRASGSCASTSRSPLSMMGR